MKYARMAFIAASSAFLIGCASVPVCEVITRRIGPDYMATGAVEDIRAYFYGNRTVLQFDKAPSRLSVRDENGDVIPYEKEGNYYRLARKAESFTAWVDGSPVKIAAILSTDLRVTTEMEWLTTTTTEPENLPSDPNGQ